MKHHFRSAHSAERVLQAYADEVPGFASELPGVLEVVVLEERREGTVLYRTHLWRADVRSFPAFLTSWIDPKLFEWTTSCRWDLDELGGTWTLEIGAFGEGTHIRGAHRFSNSEPGSLTEVEGEVLLQSTHFATVTGIPVMGPVHRALDRLIRRVFSEIVAKSGAVVEAALDSPSV